MVKPVVVTLVSVVQLVTTNVTIYNNTKSKNREESV